MRMPREGKYWVARFHCVIQMDVECTHAYGDRSRCCNFEPSHIPHSIFRFSARQHEKIMDQLFRIPNHYYRCHYYTPETIQVDNEKLPIACITHGDRMRPHTIGIMPQGNCRKWISYFIHMGFMRVAWRRLSLIESDRITYL